MTVKINVKDELGIAKPIVVKESNKNYLKTLKFQKDITHFQIEQAKQEKAEKAKQEKIEAGEDVAPVDELEEFEEMERQLDEYINFQGLAVNYVAEMLHLSDSNADKLDDLELKETQELAIKVSDAIMKTESEPATEEDKGLTN